ncbi:MAG: ATP-binding protein, partial [Deferrisomatales bacterium]
MTVPGPTRLVLLRAGKYDYGEVELTRPLHLVGPNNVGKTSLIATLQFLYIDDQRHMHFSRDLAETRRYYFPDADSYEKFECMTPTGFQGFGVQGLGPLKQYDLQRFAYQGRFDREDYLDDERRVRPPEEIRARLAPRGYTLLEPRHLRAALTGIGEGRGVHLGLVPLKHRDHYERFRALFRNLLRLAHLRQEELKDFLIEIHAGEFQQRAIDLERDYAGQYEKVRRGADELRDLNAIEPEARRLLALAAGRDRLRRELPALWAAAGEAYGREEAKAAAELARLGERRAGLADAETRTEAERSACQGR